MENSCLELLKSIANSKTDFVVIFKENDIVLTNSSFNKFFGVNSTKEYIKNFGDFVNNFVPHPSYFNAQKVNEGETWFASILKLNAVDRVVSFLSQTHEPHAYSVSVNEDVTDYKIVTFTDITQSLIKRIMIENHTNIDKKSGAYTKQYFLQIKKSYEDASVFNEKLIGLTLLELFYPDEMTNEILKEFVAVVKLSIRQDDMLVKWSSNSFLLAYLVDEEQKAQAVVSKLQMMLNKNKIDGLTYETSSVLQKEKESISKLINNLP